MSLDHRNVTIRWTNTGMTGDEVLEMWRREGAGAWALIESIAVEPTELQEYTHEGIDAGTDHSFQIRPSRGGSYAVEYQSGDPDEWPALSLLEYTTELPVPVLTSTGWERTGAATEIIGLDWTGHDPSKGVKVYRKRPAGAFVLVHTTAAGVSTYDYPVVQPDDDELALEFKVVQEGDAGEGTFSNTITELAGLAPPENLAQVAPIPRWYEYEVEWALGYPNAQTRVHDDYLCNDNFANRALTAANALSAEIGPLEKASLMEPNGNDTVQIDVRVRHEITWFTVTDVSAWVLLGGTGADVDIASDETEFNSCP